jgi:hypothetical protein
MPGILRLLGKTWFLRRQSSHVEPPEPQVEWTCIAPQSAVDVAVLKEPAWYQVSNDVPRICGRQVMDLREIRFRPLR